MDLENSPHARAVRAAEARRSAEDRKAQRRSGRRRARLLLLGQGLGPLTILIFPAVVLPLSSQTGRPVGELLPLALGGFIAFGVVSLAAGRLAERLGARATALLFFWGAGAACIGVGAAQDSVQIAAGLTLTGLFAATLQPTVLPPAPEDRRAARSQAGRGRLFGVLGIALAALLACVLAEFVSWRAAFLAPGAASVTLGVLYLRLAPAAAAARRTPTGPAGAATARAPQPAAEGRRPSPAAQAPAMLPSRVTARTPTTNPLW